MAQGDQIASLQEDIRRLRKPTRKVHPAITWEEDSCGHQAIGRPGRLSNDVRSGTLAKDGTRCSLGTERRVQAGFAMGNDLGSSDKRTEVTSYPKARNAGAQYRGSKDILEIRIAYDVRRSFGCLDHNRDASERMHRPQVAGPRLGS